MIRSASLVASIALCAAGAAHASPEKEAAKAGSVYRCVGFDEPLHNSPMQVSKGRVLPLRLKLAGPGDTFALTKEIKAPPRVRVAQITDSGEEDKTDSLEASDYGKGDQFAFDQEAHWKFDLGTNPFEEGGKFRVTIVSGDEKAYRVEPTCELVFTLRGDR